MSFLMRTVVVVVMLSVVCAGMLNAAEGHRRAVRLFAEAEDFHPVDGGWKVVPYRQNYFASTFAITFLSRMACLGAPAQMEEGQPAIAEQTVTIPYGDRYEVLARYEQPYNFSVEFDVEIVQDGETVYRGAFGRLDQVKIWGCSGGPEARRAPMQRFFWGATDNIVWQAQKSVQLAAGEATIRLIAGRQMDGGQARRRAAARNVDLVVLTNDSKGRAAQRQWRNARTYLEMDGWLVQEGDLYLRLTNRGEEPVAPVLQPYNQGQHSPYYVHLRDWPSIRVLRNGHASTASHYINAGPRSEAVRERHIAAELPPEQFENTPEEQHLRPGERSGWVPMGRMLDALNDSIWRVNPQAPLHLEFAIPDGEGGLKTVREIDVSEALGFEIPGVVNPNDTLRAHLESVNRPPVIRTQEEALAWLLGKVEEFPEFGQRPDRFLIYNIGGFGSTLRYPTGRKLAEALGDNTAVNEEGKKRGLIAHWRNPDPAWIRKKEQSRSLDDVRIVSYGDEMHLPAIKPTDEEFGRWLKRRGVQFDGPVQYTTDRDDPLYYYSKLCAKENGAERYARGTAYYASRGVLTGTNYSPHSNYLVTEMDYIRPFKLGALTMPWSEDYVWQIPEFSVQVTGYLTSAFRAGAKYHDNPIHMYVMPHSPGNTPRDFRLSFYTAVAHGAKMINYFCASPMATGGTENYVATDDLEMWRAIDETTHAAGVFEDYVMDGRVRPARVGLLLSSVDDIMTGATNTTLAMHNNERKAIYYALRHAQVPVDFLSEDDVIGGRAGDYELIYLTQQWVHSEAIDALRGWVEEGGTLVAHVGGGFRNEFDRPNPAAKELYGVRRQRIRRDPDLLDYIQVENRPFLTKQDLPVYEPIDRVGWDTGEGRIEDMGVVVWKQTLVPADGTEVRASFGDGSPAVVEKTHGRGRAVLVGFLPGQAYLKSGLPLRPVDRGSTNDAFAHFLPTQMRPAYRRAMVQEHLPDGFQRPVRCSVDLVEASVIDTAQPRRRMAVPLMNYTGDPIESLTVTVRGAGGAGRVQSLYRGEIEPVRDGEDIEVRLPLETADMLLIDF